MKQKQQNSFWFKERQSAKHTLQNYNMLELGKSESWKYTRFLQQASDYKQGSITTKNVNYNNSLSDNDIIYLVDGEVDSQKSKIPNSVKIIDLKNISDEDDQIIKSMLNEESYNKPDKIQVAANLALTDKALMFYVKKNQQDNLSFEIHHVTSSDVGNKYQQIWFFIEDGATVKLIERMYSGYQQKDNDLVNTTINNYCNIYLSKNSKLEHVIIQDYNSDINFYNSNHIKMFDNSSYNSFSCVIGANIYRQETYTKILGEHVNNNQYGISVGNKSQHHDLYIRTLHLNKNSCSRQKFKHILDDKAKSVFYGSVFADKDASSTEAHQHSQNLLLSNHAHSYSRPELEIYVDDVICTHGSSTGNINDEQIFYLQARGIDKQEAKILLLKAFVDELIDSVSDENIKILLSNIIENKLLLEEQEIIKYE